MTFTVRKVVLGLAAAGALTLGSAVPAFAGSGPTGPGTAICGPSNGSFHAAGGPGYGQYTGPPVADQAFVQACLAH
jgi:hypothetical protein